MQSRSPDRAIDQRHFGLLLLWIGLGACLRFAYLDAKPPSTIEIATFGFSLGHGFLGMPVNQVIDLGTLLQPLQVDPNITGSDAVGHLMQESTHPPLFFWLMHYWLTLLSPANDVVSLTVGRSLSALLGVAAIPAMFGLGWLAFGSRVAGQLAAVLMAISPYGVYLAQEARHYTLAVLWIIASLSCLVAALRWLRQQRPLPAWIGWGWFAVNTLGMATHYFFALVLCAEGLVLAGVWCHDWWRWQPDRPRSRYGAPSHAPYWWRIYAVAIGTAIGALIWLPWLTGISDSELTQWIHTRFKFSDILSPLGRLCAWIITMLWMLPIEDQSAGVIGLMAIVLVVALIWTIPALVGGWRAEATTANQDTMVAIGGFVAAAVGLILIAAYGRGPDLTLAPRYHFVYFPGVIALVAAALARQWRPGTRGSDVPVQSASIGGQRWQWFSQFRPQGRQLVAFVLVLSLLGSIVVVTNQGFKKSKHTDVLVDTIAAHAPGLIATEYKTHAEIRAAIAIGYEIERRQPPVPTPASQSVDFILLSADQSAGQTLMQTLEQVQRPFDLWTIDLSPKMVDAATQTCTRVDLRAKTNYAARHYHCNS